MGKFWDKLRRVQDKTRPFCTAIVPAAGSSTRMGGQDKLLADLCGTPVLMRTLCAIDKTELVDEIIVATRQDLLLTVADLCSRCGLHKPVKVVLGGPTRAQSVLAAAVEANPKAGLLAVHDAARPLVDPAEFDEIIRFACRTNAAAPAVPVTDTIKTADPTDGRVLSTPDRSTLFAVQTPQVMEASLLKAALQSAIDAGVELTDDQLLELCMYATLGPELLRSFRESARDRAGEHGKAVPPAAEPDPASERPADGVVRGRSDRAGAHGTAKRREAAAQKDGK